MKRSEPGSPVLVWVCLLVAGGMGVSARGEGWIAGIEFRGEAILPKDLRVGGTTVGGLSAIAYDRQRGRYLVLSDDKGEPDSARFYEATIDLGDGRLESGGVEVRGVTTLRRADGTVFPRNTIDPEGIALTGDGRVYVSSEGEPGTGSPPFVRRFDARSGHQVEDLVLPEKFLPGASGGRGVRPNLGFESLTVTPSGRWLYTATENALVQDGPAVTGSVGSRSRILRFDLATGLPSGEFLYETEPIAGTSGFFTGGLVELLALSDTRFLALERSLALGGGFSARLYEVSLEGATDIRGLESLAGGTGVIGASKRLVLDLTTLGRPLWNLEGMTFGPELGDGRRSLILVSDDNFSRFESTQFLAFAVRVVPEPSSAGLTVLGMLGLVGLAASRMKGVRG